MARAGRTVRCTTCIRRSCSRSACRRWPRGSASTRVRSTTSSRATASSPATTTRSAGSRRCSRAGPSPYPGMTLNRFCGSAQQAITVAAMGVASGHQDLVVGGGVESMSRWDLTVGSRHHRRRQPRLPRPLPDRAAGHLGRSHRHARRVQPRRRRRVRGGEPAAGRRRGHRGPVRPRDRRGDRSRRRGAPRARRAPAPRHDARRTGEAAPRVRGAGRDLRRDGAHALPGGRPHRSRPPRRQLVRRRRRGGRRARGVRRLDRRARGDAPGARPRHRRGRFGTRHHADRARPRGRAVPRQGGDDHRRHRSLGGQRGVRGRADEDDPRPRPRSRRA